MADENNPNPLPEPPPVPPENQESPAPAPPPAAALVTTGEVTDERILAAERRALNAERRAAELERDNEELKNIPSPAPAPPVKAEKRWQFSPIIGADENDD